MVTGTNYNITYHLAELDRTMITVPITKKRLKAFKKWYKSDPNPELEEDDTNGNEESDEDPVDDGSGEDK